MPVVRAVNSLAMLPTGLRTRLIGAGLTRIYLTSGGDDHRVAGVYSSLTHSLMVTGMSRYNAGVVLHELGHAAGDLLNF